jgi:hypothetical protein
MAHVFISYAHDDFEFAENLKQRLEKSGFGVWMDSEGIRLGEDWREEIDVAIEDSFVLLLIISPNSMSSPYVTYEWSFALGAHKNVLPILYQAIDSKLLHQRLDKRQYLNFTNRAEREWERLTRELHKFAESFSSPKIHLTSQLATQHYKDLDLLNYLTHEDPGKRRAGINVVASREISEAKLYIHHLIELLNDPDIEVRKAAVDALGSIGEEASQAVPHLLVVLQTDSNASLRALTSNSLGSIRDKSAIPVLCRVLSEDKDLWVRQSSVHAIGLIGDTGYAFGYLSASLLDEKEELVRAEIADTLGWLGNPDAVPKLIDCLHDPSKYVQEIVVEALKRIGTPNALEAVGQWQEKQNEQET